MKALSWKPVRRGAHFCSPACGRGCTFHEYRKAQVLGGILARQLGSGWKADVWENLGWHYRALSPCRKIRVHHGYTGGYYTAYLDDGQFAEHGTTPTTAVRAVIRSGLAYLSRMSHTMSGLQALHDEFSARAKKGRRK